MNNTQDVILRLHRIFSAQLAYYRQLTDLSRTVIASLARSKGDISTLMTKMDEKQRLLNQILYLKEEAMPDILVWQKKKHSVSQSEANALDVVLGEVETQIKSFFEVEKMLQKQIDYYRTL